MPSGEGGNHPIYRRAAREGRSDLVQLGGKAPFFKSLDRVWVLGMMFRPR